MFLNAGYDTLQVLASQSVRGSLSLGSEPLPPRAGRLAMGARTLQKDQLCLKAPAPGRWRGAAPVRPGPSRQGVSKRACTSVQPPSRKVTGSLPAIVFSFVAQDALCVSPRRKPVAQERRESSVRRTPAGPRCLYRGVQLALVERSLTVSARPAGMHSPITRESTINTARARSSILRFPSPLLPHARFSHSGLIEVNRSIPPHTCGHRFPLSTGIPMLRRLPSSDPDAHPPPDGAGTRSPPLSTSLPSGYAPTAPAPWRRVPRGRPRYPSTSGSIQIAHAWTSRSDPPGWSRRILQSLCEGAHRS